MTDLVAALLAEAAAKTPGFNPPRSAYNKRTVAELADREGDHIRKRERQRRHKCGGLSWRDPTRER